MNLVEITHGSGIYSRELELRDETLRKPIGLKHSEADLVAEKDYRHFGILLGDQLVACLMIVPKGEGLVQLRQMAVRADLHGRGFGRYLVKGVEPLLRASGVEKVFLNARWTAIEFYRKLGYEPVGDRFIEVGIPHLRMEKSIAPAIPTPEG